MVRFCRLKGMTIGDDCKISDRVNIGTEPYLISIGNHCEITCNVQLVTHDGAVWVFRKEHPEWDMMGKITIHDNVYIGFSAIILPGVTIHKNSIVGAGAVVTKDIPAGTVVAGIPAKAIGTVDRYRKKCLASSMPTKGLVGSDKRRAVLNHIESKS